MNQVIRETWLAGTTVDYKFAMGRVQNPAADELSLDVEDGRDGLTHKTQGMMGYALLHGYDFLFRCDNDTYVVVDRLLASGFETREVTNGYGGTGIWLRADAMRELLAYGQPVFSPNSGVWETWDTWGMYDDKWITATRLQLGKGYPYIDERYSFGRDQGPLPRNDVITYHQDQGFSLRIGDRMREVHSRFKGKQ
jgi:hypothetical protein